jgi:chromate transporter
LLLLLFTANILTFGSGRVMVPILERALVYDTNAMGLDQFLFAFTVGRITPGPATLYVAGLAYMLHGALGATLAVIMITIPAYLIVPLHAGYRRLAGSGTVRGLGRGLTAASVGLILASTVDIGRDTLITPVAVTVCGLTLVMMYALRWNTLLTLLGACVAGLLLTRVFPA